MYFPSKSLNYTAITLFLQKLSTSSIAKVTISTRTDITLQTSVKLLRAFTMCSAFTPDYGYDNSNIILIGDVNCPETECSGKLGVHKKTFQSLGRSDYQCPQCASVYQVRNIPFEDQTNSFSFGHGVYIFEESSKSIQDVIGDVYCPGNYCSIREKCESLDGYVTTPRSIYCCGKCGAWLLVHKVPFKLQEHVKTTKTDKTRFFFAKKDELGTQQLLLNVPFQTTKYKEKELCVDHKVQETIEDVYCSTSRNEKCVYISTNKTTSFHDCKKCSLLPRFEYSFYGPETDNYVV